MGLAPGTGPGLFQGWDTGSASCSTEYRAIYESGWVRVPTADFEMNAIGVKFLGYTGVGKNCSGSPASQIYFFSNNTPYTGQTEIRAATNLNVVQQDVADRLMRQNVTTGLVFTFGEWHHYEYLMELNDLGVANGTLKVWWDDQLITEYTDVMWRTPVHPSGFFGRHWNAVWGGGGGTPKLRDDYLQVDHIYLSGIACDPTLGCA